MNKKPFKAADGPMLMLIAFVVTLVAQLVMSVVLVATQGLGETASDVINCIGLLLFQAAFISTYLVYTKKRNIVSSFSPRNKITVWSVLAGVLIGIICFFCFAGLAYYFEYLLKLTGYVGSGMEINTTAGIILLIVATVIVAPMCEETIFRSAFLSGVTNAHRDEIGPCLLSGLCFALMHINPEQTVYQFCLGAAAAYVAIKSRSVIPAMVMHSTSNLLAVLMSFTKAGNAVDGFYMKVESNVLIALLLCLLLPIVACVIIWLIGKYLKKTEQKKYPNKFKSARVIWIDENTKLPIYEGEEAPVITEENRMLQQGFSPFTGTPILVDRLEQQKTLMDEYQRNNDQSGGKSYRRAFIIYFALTMVLWIFTLISGYLLQYIQ